MGARPAEATKASSFAVLARRNNQNRIAIGLGMVSHALLRSADGAQVAALGNQGHRRQSRHIYGPTLTRSSPHPRCWLRNPPARRLHGAESAAKALGLSVPQSTRADEVVE